MLINEQFRKCVAFLVTNRQGEYIHQSTKKPAGTAFFVRVSIMNEHIYQDYAVTARHAIDKSRQDGKLYIRVNTTDGGVEDIETQQDDWSSLPLTDVAVKPIRLDASTYDIVSIPLSMFEIDEKVESHEIGIGDDVFFVGLFSEHAGQERNQPIIRFGNISLMPNEPLSLKLDSDPDSQDRTDAYVYLVEAKSWGGLSGSPAFIYYPFDRKPGISMIASDANWKKPFKLGEGKEFGLLGLVHGHYPIKQEILDKGNILGKVDVPISAGIAVIIPAQRIYDTIMNNELSSERENALKA